LWEGLGGAAVEAAAAALPIVAFSLPAVREVVGPEHPWLVGTGDADALGQAIVEVLEAAPEARQRVAMAQRARFFEHYELSVVVHDMAQLYRDVHDATKRDRAGTLHRVPRVRWSPRD
jgi:glycosyltransferase involved in cell wall biosynthesis